MRGAGASPGRRMPRPASPRPRRGAHQVRRHDRADARHRQARRRDPPPRRREGAARRDHRGDRRLRPPAVHRARLLPVPLNYNGYPKSVCTSVNEVICHGIPDSRPLQDGDIVNLDVTAYHGGVHGDTNATFFVGDVDPQSRQLVARHRGGDVAGHRGGQARSAAQRHRQGDRDTRQEVPLWRHPGIRRPRHRRAVPRRHPGAPLLRRAAR